MREQKNRDRFLASRSDLIKDAVRTARQTDRGGGKGDDEGRDDEGPEGRNRPPSLSRRAELPDDMRFPCFFHPPLRFPPLRYVTGGLVPL